MRRKNPGLPHAGAYKDAVSLMILIITDAGDDGDEAEFYESLLPASNGPVKEPKLSLIEEDQVAIIKLKRTLESHNLDLSADGITIIGSDEQIQDAICHIMENSDTKLARIIFRDTFAHVSWYKIQTRH